MIRLESHDMLTSRHDSNRPEAPSSKSPKKRVLTPARKEQNRIAQRAYRERQRENRKSSNTHVTRAKRLAPRSPPESSESEPNDPLVTFLDTVGSLDTPSSTLSVVKHGNDALSTSPADFWMNTLETPQVTMWAAIFSNAICLGHDVELLSACSLTYMSPFYKPITPQDNPRDLVISAMKPSIPIHLQPTMAQILVPHHASLDLIPLPILRDRAIMMCFAMPDIFDLWDFKLDIYTRNALVCHRHRPDKSCHPWDPKSWEAMPWFLKKWSPAVDQ
ncbi:uncharacterized protein N7479_010846 [Penicillium vulpinum]|nr:uncharacterized protein N7479_010846 [Penicillium vulpinum]KAJ5952433.1 hypothetical protein N7479_010846 [Penicillium vulpinum]